MGNEDQKKENRRLSRKNKSKKNKVIVAGTQDQKSPYTELEKGNQSTSSDSLSKSASDDLITSITYDANQLKIDNESEELGELLSRHSQQQPMLERPPRVFHPAPVHEEPPGVDYRPPQKS